MSRSKKELSLELSSCQRSKLKKELDSVTFRVKDCLSCTIVLSAILLKKPGSMQLSYDSCHEFIVDLYEKSVELSTECIFIDKLLDDIDVQLFFHVKPLKKYDSIEAFYQSSCFSRLETLFERIPLLSVSYFLRTQQDMKVRLSVTQTNNSRSNACVRKLFSIVTFLGKFEDVKRSIGVDAYANFYVEIGENFNFGGITDFSKLYYSYQDKNLTTTHRGVNNVYSCFFFDQIFDHQVRYNDHISGCLRTKTDSYMVFNDRQYREFKRYENTLPSNYWFVYDTEIMRGSKEDNSIGKLSSYSIGLFVFNEKVEKCRMYGHTTSYLNLRQSRETFFDSYPSEFLLHAPPELLKKRSQLITSMVDNISYGGYPNSPIYQTLGVLFWHDVVILDACLRRVVEIKVGLNLHLSPITARESLKTYFIDKEEMLYCYFCRGNLGYDTSHRGIGRSFVEKKLESFITKKLSPGDMFALKKKIIKEGITVDVANSFLSCVFYLNLLIVRFPSFFDVRYDLTENVKDVVKKTSNRDEVDVEFLDFLSSCDVEGVNSVINKIKDKCDNATYEEVMLSKNHIKKEYRNNFHREILVEMLDYFPLSNEYISVREYCKNVFFMFSQEDAETGHNFRSFYKLMKMMADVCIHHCHVSGRHLGLSHRHCNSRAQFNPKTMIVPFFAHNSAFDMKILRGSITQSLKNFICNTQPNADRKNLVRIMGNNDKYVSVGQIEMKDSLAFMPSSLSKLVDALSPSYIEAMKKQLFEAIFTLIGEYRDFDNLSAKELEKEKSLIFESLDLRMSGKSLSLYNIANYATLSRRNRTYPSKDAFLSHLQNFKSIPDDLYEHQKKKLLYVGARQN